MNNKHIAALQIVTTMLCTATGYTHREEQTTTTTAKPDNFNFYNFGYVGPWPAIIQQVLIGSTIAVAAFAGYKAYNSINNKDRDYKYSTNNDTEMKEYNKVETTGDTLAAYHAFEILT